MTEHPLELDLPADLPLVRCDALLIERVLVNLLENATKYTPPGTAIGVTATKADEVLRVEVWDEGPGLPLGQERVIFEKFVRRCAVPPGPAKSKVPWCTLVTW